MASHGIRHGHQQGRHEGLPEAPRSAGTAASTQPAAHRRLALATAELGAGGSDDEPALRVPRRGHGQQILRGVWCGSVMPTWAPFSGSRLPSPLSATALRPIALAASPSSVRGRPRSTATRCSSRCVPLHPRAHQGQPHLRRYFTGHRCRTALQYFASQFAVIRGGTGAASLREY
jgi:hypothetical protein